MARVSEKAPGHRSRGFARKNKIRSSSIQTVTVGTGVAPVQPPPKAAGRGLYRQWGIAPRPEDLRYVNFFTNFIIVRSGRECKHKI